MQLLKKSYVKHGLVMCGLIALCLVLMEVTGENMSFEKSPFQVIFTMIAPFVVWYYGIRARKVAQHGSLTFKEGVAEGFKISVVFAIVSPFIFALYYIAVNPAIVNSVRQAYGLTDAPFTKVVMIDMFVQFISAIIFGTIYAAILSTVMKSKKSKSSAAVKSAPKKSAKASKKRKK